MRIPLAPYTGFGLGLRFRNEYTALRTFQLLIGYYPRGLTANDIPLSARLFAVVDVWDALRVDRPYRLAWPEARVLAYIREQSGRHFDPQVAEAFLKLAQGDAGLSSRA